MSNLVEFVSELSLFFGPDVTLYTNSPHGPSTYTSPPIPPTHGVSITILALVTLVTERNSRCVWSSEYDRELNPTRVEDSDVRDIAKSK